MTAAPRVVLLVTSPRVAPGLLSADAWSVVQSGPVFTADPDAAGVSALRAASVVVREADRTAGSPAIAGEVLAAAREHGTATWWVGPDGDEPIARALAERVTDDAAGSPAELEILHGSWDVPGSRLLDLVATMDRLRSPGGCPWDAAQDHATLAPYLLEEAYEAFQAIEDGDLDGLREELGDVLLQIAFHARLAEELPEDERWTIDDVAGGLVEKLIRRHPHVFDGLEVADADEVNANWETIKAAERGDASPLSSVPMAAPALTLAATLQRKATRAGHPNVGAGGVSDLAAAFTAAPSEESAGDLLWAVVAAMRAVDLDAEAALRARARQYRDGALDPPNG